MTDSRTKDPDSSAQPGDTSSAGTTGRHEVREWALPVPLHTPRTTLRRHAPEDIDDLLLFHSDPEVTRHLPWPVRNRDEVAVALQTKLVQTHLDVDGSWLSLAVEDLHTGRVVGEALVSRMSGEAGIAEIGYALAKDVHGRGMGFEVVSALLDAAWRHLPVRQVMAHVEVENQASRRLLGKLGFHHRGNKNDDAASSLLRYVLLSPG